MGLPLFCRYITYGGHHARGSSDSSVSVFCFAFVAVSCYMILYSFITIILSIYLIINIVLECRRQGKLVQRQGMGEWGERVGACSCLPF